MESPLKPDQSQLPSKEDLTPAAKPHQNRPIDSPMRRYRWLRRLGWSLILILILLIAGEIILRVHYGLAHPLLYQHDPDCIYLPKPDQTIRRFGAFNHINHFSMRSIDIEGHKKPGTYRLLLIGDSVAYGTTYIDQSQIASSILQLELPEQLHRPVEVMNIATGGWAVGNEVAYLRSRGDFDADQIIFIINTGDLTQPIADPPLAPMTSFPETSPPSALEELWVRYLMPRLFHQAPQTDPGALPKESSSQQAAAVREQLDEARKLAAKDGARFAIAYSPASGEDWNTPASKTNFEDFVVWCRRRGVPLVDLTSPYAEQRPQDIYLDNIHLKPLGQTLLASALDKFLIDQKAATTNPALPLSATQAESHRQP